MGKNFYLILLFPFSLWASEVFEFYGNIKDANLKVVKVINNISEDTLFESEKTYGFDYRYNLKWSKPYNFNIYLGSFSHKNNQINLLRVEALRNGEEKILKSIFYQELFPKQKNPYFLNIKEPFHQKSHILSQTLNFVSPFTSVIYNSYKSPLYTTSDRNSLIKAYFWTDFLIIGLASWYIRDKTPKKSLLDNAYNRRGPSYNFTRNPNGQIALGLLFFVRLFRMTGAVHDTAFHNRLAELSYSMNF